MDTVLSGQLSEARQQEAQMVAYYCISHALWLGQNVHTPNNECVEFLCTLATWQERLKPHPAQIQQASLDQNHVCEFLGSVAILCHEQRDDSGSGMPNMIPPTPREQCCISTGPATASLEIFENERHAPFVGWSAQHLLPYERGQYSNETGSATIDGLCSSCSGRSALYSIDSPPLDDFVWDGEWSIDLMYTACDQNGWSYGLSWWMLALRLRQGNSLAGPGMALVRRRKWIRHLRASAGGNLPAAIDGAPHLQSLEMRNGSRNQQSSCRSHAAAAAAMSVWAMPATMTICSQSSVDDIEQLSDTASRSTTHVSGHARSPSLLLPRAPSPPPPELPLEARNVLTTHALHAIKLAEDMMQHSDPLHMRRWFHAAAVYFEVIRSFGDLTPELDTQRQRVRKLARLCSHLHENCVAEHDAVSRRVTDVYDLPADRVLGRGSYGTVCLAIHRATREEFACKVLSINRVGPQYVDKLHAEISSMRQLDHPNVLRLREVFFGRRKIYLIMDLCTGGELFELVNTSIEHRSEKCATCFMAEMLSAVQYLHDNGVVHRDLKLENWLFEHRAGSHLKLIDFGLARHFLGHERIHGAVGSMYYVAPEVLRGSYDARCDLWSLGVIAYMLVSGAPPFWGKDDRDIRRNILAGRWEFPPQFFAGVSPVSKDFIARLLTHDPDMRMSASDALVHPWLTTNLSSKDLRMLPRWQCDELLGTLRGFAGTTPLQKVVLAVAAFHLTPPQVANMRELFAFIDVDRSGTISFSELAQAVRDLSSISREPEVIPGGDHPQNNLRTETDECQLKELFNAVDISRSSQINFTEFLAATLWQRIQLDEKHVRHVFDTLDMNGNERLNAASIKSLVGIDYDDEEVDQLIAEADSNGDGYLDYDDFLRAWRSTALQTHHSLSQNHHMGLNGVATVVHAIAHWRVPPRHVELKNERPLAFDEQVGAFDDQSDGGRGVHNNSNG
jgi:calcium-dependent protein kinase